MAKTEEEPLPNPEDLPVSVQLKIPSGIKNNIQIRAALGTLSFNEIVVKALEADALRFPDLNKEVQALAEKIRKSE